MFYSVTSTILVDHFGRPESYMLLDTASECPWTMTTETPWLMDTKVFDTLVFPKSGQGSGYGEIAPGFNTTRADRVGVVHVRWPGGGADTLITQIGF